MCSVCWLFYIYIHISPTFDWPKQMWMFFDLTHTQPLLSYYLSLHKFNNWELYAWKKQPFQLLQVFQVYGLDYWIVWVMHVQEYKPPTTKDIPIDWRIHLLPDAPNPAGIRSSKGQCSMWYDPLSCWKFFCSGGCGMPLCPIGSSHVVLRVVRLFVQLEVLS